MSGPGTSTVHPTVRLDQQARAEGLPEADPQVLDLDRGERQRRHFVLLGAVIGAALSFGIPLFEARLLAFDPIERFAVPALGIALLGLALLAWRRHHRIVEWWMVGTAGLMLLARLHGLLREPASDLERLIHGYELMAWLPCLYLFTFLLFEKRAALAVSLSMLVASVLIAYEGALDGAHRVGTPKLYASHLLCIACVYALARLKERYVETHRLAVVLRSFAETDFLTGVANRRALTQALEREIARCERRDASLGVLLLDVDHFKDVNDRLGHEEGDRALRRVAFLMDVSRRRADLFGRWGGEEFLLVAPDLDLAGARAAAERLRGIIEDSSRDSRAPLTASFGVAEYVPGDTVASLVKRADHALRQAKQAGRNRVEACAA
jgi:diguanylate cyclase (GGDEF)-like protein